VTPHAAGLALITPRAAGALANLQGIVSSFPCAYLADDGFLDSVMTDPAAPDYGQCSTRFSALGQAWLFLSLSNLETGVVWDSFYRDAGVIAAHVEMYGGCRITLPALFRQAGAP
jgi:hypothetical protein